MVHCVFSLTREPVWVFLYRHCLVPSRRSLAASRMNHWCLSSVICTVLLNLQPGPFCDIFCPSCLFFFFVFRLIFHWHVPIQCPSAENCPFSSHAVAPVLHLFMPCNSCLTLLQIIQLFICSWVQFFESSSFG